METERFQLCQFSRFLRADASSADCFEPYRLQNGYVVCAAAERTAMLLRILKQEAFVTEGEDVAGARKFIVYFATCACVDYFFKVRLNLS